MLLFENFFQKKTQEDYSNSEKECIVCKWLYDHLI